MTVLFIPALDAMPPQAEKTLAIEVAQFAAGRAAGEELPGSVIAADRPGAEPIFVYLQEIWEMRLVQVGIATAIMATRDGATSALWLCDTFMSIRKAGSDLDVDPADDPRAVEALLLAYVTADAGWTTSIPYRRGDGGELTWEQPEYGWKQVGSQIDGPIVDAMTHALRYVRGGLGPLPVEPPDGVWADLGIDMRGRAS